MGLRRIVGLFNLTVISWLLEFLVGALRPVAFPSLLLLFLHVHLP